MTTTNGKIAAIEAENAMLRQRISELEAQLTSRNDHIAPSNHQEIEEFRGFRTLIETAPQAIGILTFDGIITYANAAFATLTGYDSLIGMNMTALYFEEDLPLLRAHAQSLIASNTWRGVARLRQRDGSAIPVRINAFVIRDDDGQPVAMTGMFEDLTEELQREERLRLFEALVENAPDAIGVADFKGNIHLRQRCVSGIDRLRRATDRDEWLRLYC